MPPFPAHENSVFLPFMLKSMSCFCEFTLFNLFLIIDPPSITIKNISETVEEGDSITLTCYVTGKPPPFTTWTKLGSSEVLPITSLTIVNVSRPGTPDNMIQYQCTASNGVGTPATATVNVIVHCE